MVRVAGHIWLGAGTLHLKDVAKFATGAKDELDLALVEAKHLQGARQGDPRGRLKSILRVGDRAGGRGLCLSDQRPGRFDRE